MYIIFVFEILECTISLHFSSNKEVHVNNMLILILNLQGWRKIMMMHARSYKERVTTLMTLLKFYELNIVSVL